MTEQTYLFSVGELRAFLESRLQQLRTDIDSIPPDEFLNTSPGDLADYFAGEFTIAIPVAHYDKVSVSQQEAQVDVSGDPRRIYIRDRSRPAYVAGTDVAFHVPFEGDRRLFDYRPSRFSPNPPEGVVGDGELVFSYLTTDHDAETLGARFDQDLNQLRRYLAFVAEDASPFNAALLEDARNHIQARRDRLLADRGLAASLGYPIHARPDAPGTYAPSTSRRKPPTHRPKPATSEPYKPEPTIAMAEYENILGILSNMVQVIERSPEAFKTMREEDLRQHFLVQLNGHYEGSATGETFNFGGKTDILIRAEGKNIFIAECKFWRGPKALAAAVDQLLGYASWRDTKTAILLFNRGKNLSDVLAKVLGVMSGHSSFKRELAGGGETTFRYVFHHRDDPNRELIITVLVFEVPG